MYHLRAAAVHLIPPPRHRFHVALATVLLARCVLILSTFLLLPPHAWASHAWAGYVISASTSPLVNALALSVYDQLVKVGTRPLFAAFRSVSGPPRVHVPF